MTTTTGNPHTRSAADQGRSRHVLLGDDQGRLMLRRLRPWHRVLARCAAGRLDRELARLTGHQTAPGPVPAQGVAIINQLLADGTGPLYRQACADDLSDIIQNAARALTC